MRAMWNFVMDRLSKPERDDGRRDVVARALPSLRPRTGRRWSPRRICRRGLRPRSINDGGRNVHHKALWPLEKKSRRGFRGYPVATVAFYGPDDRLASKVAVGIVKAEGSEPEALERWFLEHSDIRSDTGIAAEVSRFIVGHGAKSIVLADRIIGCPHEEGVDYREGTACPHCPFWARRDRWSGEPARVKGRAPLRRERLASACNRRRSVRP